MNANRLGKFEMRGIIDDFDNTLIRMFGVNMLDAGITRRDALTVTTEVGCPRKAAEVVGQRLGLAPQAA